MVTKKNYLNDFYETNDYEWLAWNWRKLRIGYRNISNQFSNLKNAIY